MAPKMKWVVSFVQEWEDCFTVVYWSLTAHRCTAGIKAGVVERMWPGHENLKDNGFSMQNAWGVFRTVHENVVHQSQKPHRSLFVHQLVYGISGFDFGNDEATWINGKVRSDTYFNWCVYQHLSIVTIIIVPDNT